MKKLLISAYALALLAMGACSSSTKTEEHDSTPIVVNDTDSIPADTIDSIAAPDTLVAIHNIPFETKKMEKKKGDNELEIEYPVKGNEALVDSVRTWISRQLGDSYKGDLNKPDAFFKHYYKKLGDEDMEEFGGYTVDKFELEFTDDYIVTYEHSSFEFEGGEHGNGGEYGMTFLQSNGKAFSKKCINSYSARTKLFIDGLKQYFKVKTDAQLTAKLRQGIKLTKLPAPAMTPWIDKEGIVFSYTPYEITSEPVQPKFTIPYSAIEPYLTDEGKQFFGK